MKKLMLLICFSISQLIHAGNTPQSVMTCLIIKKNDSKNAFQVMQVSSDFFDRYKKTPEIKEGAMCLTRTYRHGPKSIKFKLRGVYNEHSDMVLIPDSSCSFMDFHRFDWAGVESSYHNTDSADQRWDFTITQAPRPNFPYYYLLSCNHIS